MSILQINYLFMKLVIFAGGRGTRLWPLSRENRPKQFDRIFSGFSTLELAIKRLRKTFGIENIYIQTINEYKEKVLEQVPDLPAANLFIEPGRRNLGPAVYFALDSLKRQGHHGVVTILWADHLINHPERFIAALLLAEKTVKKNKNKIIFLGEEPRFANNNIGWIKVDKKIDQTEGHKIFSFKGWVYKPTPEECHLLYSQKTALWNPGYFVSTIDFLLSKYSELSPDIPRLVNAEKYQEIKPISFDRAIIEKLLPSQAIVIKTNMGWSDPGTLYALKRALEKKPEDNVLEGEVIELNCSDSLLYNIEDNKLLAAVGLKGYVVVNTNDALLVAPKDEVVNITKLIDKLYQEGRSAYA